MLLINLKKILHFEKKIVVNNKVTVVQILLCITTSIWPAKDMYLKYITPKKPHQKDPNAVRNIPLLKFLLIITIVKLTIIKLFKKKVVFGWI